MKVIHMYYSSLPLPFILTVGWSCIWWKSQCTQWMRGCFLQLLFHVLRFYSHVTSADDDHDRASCFVGFLWHSKGLIRFHSTQYVSSSLLSKRWASSLLQHNVVQISHYCSYETAAEHVHSSSQIYSEKGRNAAPWSLSLSWRKSFFCGTIAFRCGQTARSPHAKKKNTHFLKMKCFERNDLWGESPLVETSNINSQRESSVGDKNQFHKVWSFPSAGTTKYRADKRPVT